MTPLEYGLLSRFSNRYNSIGFPSVDDLVALSRTNTGSGRYTYFSHDGDVRIADGQLGLGVYSQLNMEGLEAGASFWVYIENQRVRYLEIAVNGDTVWDGVERPWTICDPDTGAFSK